MLEAGVKSSVTLKEPLRVMFDTETELVDKLTLFMAAEGYRVRIEVANMGQSADIVATKGRWVTAVEAKLQDWRRALIQCRAHEQVADYICIAIGSANVSDLLLREAEELGYGVIHFDAAQRRFGWVLNPKVNRNVWRPQRQYWSKQMRGIRYAC